MIRLRGLVSDDAPAVRRVYSGAAVSFLGRPAMTDREAVAYVLRAARREVYGVDDDGDLVGLVKLDRRPGAHGRLSYVVREDRWGRGYATEAVRRLVSLAFGTAGLVSLGAGHHPGNPASGRVLAKAGFTRLGPRDGVVEYHLAARPRPAASPRAAPGTAVSPARAPAAPPPPVPD
ncbi:GNAT family N-acetyltransferase [Streptomyces sp. NPDC048659]|uniref:GNAT family N-acetyltransferase n=1 Tax=Streptomyces sp. NPDC048659 TaxID=3155489 RepID=UPI00343948B1